ncbi:MAG: sigma-54 dependent transcriptional regulator [Gammaproteobacteria bacterium]|nr:sigma-54 dependent transcriptional regulator [Gammaproteobacteria bacterium]
MENHSYVLVNDDCDSCLYIANAFTLLKLPLKKVSISEINDDISLISNTLSLIVCKGVETQHPAEFQSVLARAENLLLISFNEKISVHSDMDIQVEILPMLFSIDELKNVLSKNTHQQKRIADPSQFIHPVFDRLIGRSKQICEIKSFITQVANSDATVLILGESGTGKDVIASCIHYLSERSKNPLVPINCGAIPSELMESELFGHEKGAFTGALTRRPGRFEMANTGTLFLDEIGDMPLPMQVKLLRVIQDRKIERVGGNASIDVDVRLIAATNKNLNELIEQNRFREDLYYRLNVFPIEVPSLNQRKDDIPLIIDYHLDKIHDRIKHRVAFTERAMEILCQYHWPGNIRELANFLERTVILHHDCVLDEKDIDPIYKKVKKPTSQMDLLLESDTAINIKEYISNVEQHLIKMALEKSNGIINSAAEFLSLGRSALVEKMKKYNLIDAK